MVETLNAQIRSKLMQLFPGASVYDEATPQNFKKPAFIIKCFDVERMDRVNRISDTALDYDVSFIGDEVNIYNQCYKTGIELLRTISSVGGIKATNRSTNITDDVLHFKFRLNVKEVKNVNDPLMQNMDLNDNLK